MESFDYKINQNNKNMMPYVWKTTILGHRPDLSYVYEILRINLFHKVLSSFKTDRVFVVDIEMVSRL